MFRLKLNDQDVFYKHFTFPGGEEHIKIQKAGIPVGHVQNVVIDAHIKSSADFVELALLVNAVRGLGNVDRLTTFHAYIPYFPYARQDRHCDFGEPLSVKWAAEFINSMNFDRVAIKDPHSHVVTSLINNVHVVPQDYIVRQYLGWFIRGNNAVLVAPDGGAAKKTEALSLSLDGVPVVYGHKNRDTKTGEIIGVSITNPELIKDRYLVVVDDICDGGRTFVEEYYGADIDEDYVVAGSVAATEHAVMCMGTKDGEFETFRRLVQDVYPDGIVSIVSDAWDYWQVIDDYLPRLKDIIMARNGKVVIRPDSGDPVHIVGGYRIEGFKDRATLNISGVSSSTEVIHIEETNTYHLITGEGTINSLMADDRNIISRSEAVGSIQRLWEIFGGTQTETGHFLLDEHIGLIYGDSITLAREDQIFSRLAGRNFASINVVFGIGSYTYQMNTRDSTGTAVKATAGKVNGEFREIFKEPKTDKGGTKKSARGFLKVIKDSQGKLVLVDGITFDQVQDADNQHQLVYRDGKFFNTQTLEDARVRAAPLVAELASQI
ncbi:putative nicotinamide phosphoribosyl transferase [Shigella phage Ag3]|uniref:Nicotinamide phosphoribosyltransferase n=1 Tax=Shigella phage Ag3 TaxID=637730 RepID=C8XUN4_9CAUD|nr:nicotinamide phosphoribosyl transferase [Shigella phage Ag3]ACO94364.1 putative nicotinamide phosphoribosyl transferase [Shigella phage Ag3]